MTKTKKLKPTEITSETEFKQSFPALKSKPFGVINVTKSIINAIIHCECGSYAKTIQGPHSNYFKCHGCDTAYAFSEFVSISKLTKKQRDFLKSRKSIDLG